MGEKKVKKNKDNSYTLYDVGGAIVTLTFPANPNANFEVVTKDVPASGLPSEYTWLLNFGIKNPGGNFLPSASYNLDVTDPSNRNWYVFYKKQGQSEAKAWPLKGDHTSPGDPPIGLG